MHLNHSINNYEHLMLRSCYLYSIAANNSNESSLADEVVEISYPFKTPEHGVEILGSCNGLLLINSDVDTYVIWNPSTKEFKKLPSTPITFSNDRFCCRLTVYGFGYDEITEDYKVVRIILFDYDESVVDSEVKVYSLRSNRWRKIQDIPYNLTYRRVAGKLVNGALHWVANRFSNPEEDVSYTIVSFNVGDEKYRVIEQPNYEDNKFHMNLDVLGGCLCILCNFHRIRSEIWVMKDYGVKESWTKLFTISQPTVIQSFDYVRPLKFTKNGEVVFEKDNNSLFVYDPKHGTAKTLQIRGLKGWFETDTYVESLIALKSGTFVAQEQAALEGTLSNRKKKAMKRISDQQARQQARQRLYQEIEEMETVEMKKKPWDALPSLALLNIFRNLNFKDRFGSIPLVCKEWNSVISNDPRCWSSMIPESISPDDAFIKKPDYSFQVHPPFKLFDSKGQEIVRDPGVSYISNFIKKSSSGGGSSSNITSLCLDPFHFSNSDTNDSIHQDEILHLIAHRCQNLKHISFDGFYCASREAVVQVFKRCKKIELIDFSDSDYIDSVKFIEKMGKYLPNLRGIRIAGWMEYYIKLHDAIATHLPRIKLLAVDYRSSDDEDFEKLTSETKCCLYELQYLSVGLWEIDSPPVCTHISEFHYEKLLGYECDFGDHDQFQPLRSVHRSKHRPRLNTFKRLACDTCLSLKEKYKAKAKEAYSEYSIMKQKKEY